MIANINKFPLKPLQAEINEWIFTPDGSLVKSNAKKKHSQMDGDIKTDIAPTESYVFSNDPTMTISKEDAKNIIYGSEYFNYVEGKNGKLPKDLSFDKFVSGNKSTVAEIAKNIAKTYKVLDDEIHIDNPFVRRANEFNKETRQKPIQIAIQINEHLRPKTEEELYQQASGQVAQPQQESMQQSESQTPQYKYGGYHRALEQYQSGGEILSGVGSGAAAGSFLGLPGVIGGALIGGIGSLITGSSSRKKAKQAEAERLAMIAKLKENNEKSYMGLNAATFAKAATPLPKYDYLNLDENIDLVNNSYDSIINRKDSDYQSALNLGNAAQTSALRALTAAGASPDEINAQLAGLRASGISTLNQMSQGINDKFDNLTLAKARELGDIKRTIAGDTQQGRNITANNRYNRNQNVIGEFGNNYQTSLNDDENLIIQDYSTKEALRRGSAAESAQAQGAFQNGLLSVGSAGAGYKSALQDTELFNLNKQYMNNLISGRTTQSNNNGSSPTSLPTSSYTNPFSPSTFIPGESVNRGTQEYYNGLPVYIDSRTNRKYVLSPTNEMLFI